MESLLGKPAAANPEGAEGGPADAAPPGSQAAPGRRPAQAPAVPPIIQILQRCGCADLRSSQQGMHHMGAGAALSVAACQARCARLAPERQAGRACSPAHLPVVGVLRRRDPGLRRGL